MIKPGIRIITLLVFCSNAFAGESFTQSSVFENFLSQRGIDKQVVNFDTLDKNSVIHSDSVVDSIQFSYSELQSEGVELVVADDYDSTSAPHYLGTGDGGVLQGGDVLQFSTPPIHAFGLYIITPDELRDGDVLLTQGELTASLEADSIAAQLADGGKVYFLGLADDTNSFNRITLSSLEGGYFVYNLDDLTLGTIQALHPARCELQLSSEWQSGYVAFVNISNLSDDAISGWELALTLNSGHQISNAWSAQVQSSPPNYQFTHLSWNRVIQPGQSINFGFQASKPLNSVAEGMRLSGDICQNSTEIHSN